MRKDPVLIVEADWELSVIHNYVTAPKPCPHVVKILQDTGNDGELHPNSPHHPGSLVIEHQALARSECSRIPPPRQVLVLL